MLSHRIRIALPGPEERVMLSLPAESMEVLREVPEGAFDIPD
jgi:hypothetical protein